MTGPTPTVDPADATGAPASLAPTAPAIPLAGATPPPVAGPIDPTPVTTVTPAPSPVVAVPSPVDLSAAIASTPVAVATPAPATTPAAADGTTYQQDFASLDVGTFPPGWHNEADGGPSYPWLVPGSWMVVKGGSSGHALAQTRIDWPWYGGSPPLSFLRFDAPTFGQPDNGLPDRYEVDVGLRVVNCDPNDAYYPIGDTGVQVYYLDPTHYCEVVYRPHTVELWQCNGGEPDRFTGWTLLWRQNHDSQTGQTLAIRARVDVNAHTLEAWLPDRSDAQTVHPYLIQPRAHWMTLRASNSFVQVDHVTIRQI